MSKKKTAAVALIAAIAGLILAAPTIASGFARSRILDLAEERGIPLSIGAVDLGWSQTTLVDTCVEGLHERSLVCIDRLVVALPLLKAARGQLDGLVVHLSGGRADVSAEMGTPAEIQALVESWHPARDPASGTEPSGDGATRQVRELPPVYIDEFSIDAEGNGLPFSAVQIVAASVVGLDSIAVQIELSGLSLDGLLDGLHAPSGYQLTGSLVDGDKWVRVEPAEPITYRLSEGVTAQVGPIEVHDPRTGVVENFSLIVPGQEVPLLEADRVEIELRELTSSVEELFIARAEVDGLRADVLLDADGTPAVIAALRPPADVSGGEAAGDPSDSPDPEPALWEDRRWFERVPQTIRVRDGSLTVRRGDRQTLTAHEVELDYAIRAVRPQADVDLTLSLEHGGEPAGDAVVHAEFNWATEALRLDLTLEDFAIAALETPSPALESLDLAGVLNLMTRIRERDDGSIADFSGSLALSGFEVSVGLLAHPLELGEFSYSWDAATDSDGALDVQTGDGGLSGAEFTFTPRFHGFNYHRNRLFETLDVRASVPEQDANTLLAAIPSTLLGAVAQARLSGTWGYAVEFPISWADPPEDGDGPRPLTIGESSVIEVHDADLHLEHLPESVDIRRLNRAFTFSFRGPDDTINRTITARSPLAPVDSDLAPPEGEETRRANSWARLDEISYFVIAATLYQEDGRFFRNRGINWYQWRAVMEEAWLSRELGRGASTVSMQLVKNVFLSHERSIERKLQELFLTYWMTRLVSKERILETYLNIIEWGPGINGVVEAAQYYFGKSPGDLTLEESVWLSSIVPAPVRRGAQRSRGVATDWSLRHCRDIISGMHGRGWITASESEKAQTTEIHFVTSVDRPDEHPAPPVELHPQDLRDLRLGIPPPPSERPDGRLMESPAGRVRSLISGQTSPRP